MAVGGLSALDVVLTVPLLDALQRRTPSIEFVAANGTALDEARMLAVSMDSLYEPSVVRVALPSVRTDDLFWRRYN